MRAANDNLAVPRLLPYGTLPRGLSRTEASAYFGVSASLFDEMVKDGRAPRPKLINSRTIWDRVALDTCFDSLPTKDTCNPWDASYG